jgi:hypothetical protein
MLHENVVGRVGERVYERGDVGGESNSVCIVSAEDVESPDEEDDEVEDEDIVRIKRA